MRDPVERFWSKVNKDGPTPSHCPELGPCWEWTGGALNGGGYGSCRVFGKKDMAHRHAYRLANGELPSGMWVLHRCDNRRCCNPAHLFLGTSQDNNDDMWAKGRGASGDNHGLRKHPESVHRGSAHYATALNEEDIVAIRWRVAMGEPHAAVAKDYGASVMCVGKIVRGERWTHVVEGPLTLDPSRSGTRGEANPGSKLTDDSVRRIRALYDGGMSDAAIAKEYGVRPGCIWFITRRKAWKHVA